MNPELSRRVGRLFNRTMTFMELNPRERDKIADEVEKAGSFTDLSGKTMALILKAEQERGLENGTSKT